jgi:hypothetical protein
VVFYPINHTEKPMKAGELLFKDAKVRFVGEYALPGGLDWLLLYRFVILCLYIALIQLNDCKLT